MKSNSKKIFIVEDDETLLWILKQNLSEEGFSVSFAKDGKEGLEIITETTPDLVLMDIILPKMDGITVAKNLKERGIKSQIIFLTNLKDDEHITEAVISSKGKNDYIVKSDFSIDQIIARVKERLDIK